MKTKHHPRNWTVITLIIVLGASVAFNVIAISGVILISNSPYALASYAMSRNCSQSAYQKAMSQITAADTESSKKLYAASVCFTDYETGKPIDIHSVKPDTSQPASLPAKP